MQDDKNKTFIHSVDKAVTILQLFSKEKSLLTLSDISKETNFTKTTVLRYCNSLEKHNFIEKVYVGSNPYYRLGMELFVLGSHAFHTIDLPSRSRPYLQKMVDAVNENAYLFIERNKRAYCVETVKCDHVIQENATQLGESYPLYLGGGPLAILAFMEPEKQKFKLESFQLMEEEKQKLQGQLEFFRKNGYSISRNETYQGTAAVGAPIYNHEGNVTGALSLGGIVSRFTDESLPKIISVLKDASYKISVELGWKQV